MRWFLIVVAIAWSAPARAGVTSQENRFVVVLPLTYTIKSVITSTTLEPLAGVTVLAVDTATGGQTTTATDVSSETGELVLHLPAGTYDLTAYYLDRTITVATAYVVTGDSTLSLAIRDFSFVACDGFTWMHDRSPQLSAIPHHGLAVAGTFAPVSRDRTHRAMIASVAAADPATAVTTVDHGARFSAAPGIPLAFVEETVAHSLRYASVIGAGSSGAAEVTLRSGGNHPKGLARLVFGADRDPHGAVGAAELVASGPLRRDQAWIAGGLVARRSAGDEIGGDAMLRFSAQPVEHHALEISALGHAADDDTRAGWANASWTAKLHDHKLQLRGVATVETLRFPPRATARVPAETTSLEAPSIDRAGGTAAADYRFKAGGHHQLRAIAGGGGGLRGDTRHADGSFGIEDDWTPVPAITVIAGVRSSVRRFGDDQATVVAPRATLQWDPSEEGRQQIFVHYQRVSHLDDGLPGDWRGKPRFHEELAGGIAHLRSMGRTMIGISGRVRIPEQTGDDPELGGDLWLRYEGDRTIVFGQATSIDRVATMIAQHRVLKRGRSVVAIGASTRISEDEQQLGTALTWSRTGTIDHSAHALSTELSIEAHGGTGGPGGRLLLGIVW